MEDPEIQDSKIEQNWQDSDASSFIRIITPSVVDVAKLSLPKKFSKEYGNELSTTVRLSVPSGGIWDVGTESAKNRIWLNDGWKRFMEHHSILCGYFLVFKYEGNSGFGVLIFDLSGSEIEYPP